MVWSILIATHVSRDAKFRRLIDNLTPQLTDGIEVVVYWNRGSLTMGEYRQALLDEARGEYVSHVDDDDRLPEYFCSEIMAALEQKPDYVGFDVVCTDLSERPLTGKYRDYIAHHSIRYRGWYQERDHFYRDITHLNPIRTSIARLGSFQGWRSEDQHWSKAVRPAVRNESFIDRPMYFYDFAQELSVRSGRGTDTSKVERPELEPPFRYHPESDR